MPLSTADVLPAVMSVRNLDGAHRSVLHYWSLSIEEQFYLMFPLALLYLPRRALVAVLVGMVLLCGAWRGYLDLHHSTLVSIGLSTRTDLRLDEIAAGCLLALIFRHLKRKNVNGPGWLRHAVVPTALLWIAVMSMSKTRSTMYETGLLFALFALLLAHPSHWLSRALSIRPLKWLGRISYSLYLWQQLFTIAEFSSQNLTRYLQSPPFSLLLCLGAAYVSYELIEKPFQHWRPNTTCPIRAELSPQPL
jgi:peptidoglycan/LPS O-acetylase OafA/YrhL